MATQNQTKCGETQETKVVYTNTDPPAKASPMRIVGASNGDNVTNLNCKVSIRIIDFNTSRGTGCHQHALAHGWERYMDANAIPLLRKQAGRFLNWDLNDARGRAVQQLLQRVQQQRLAAHRLPGLGFADRTSGPARAPRERFDIADMSGGCGNGHFYANTTGTYSYDARTPDPTVLSLVRELRAAQRHGRQGPDDAVQQRDDRHLRQPADGLERRRLRRPRHELPVPELPRPRHQVNQ